MHSHYFLHFAPATKKGKTIKTTTAGANINDTASLQKNDHEENPWIRLKRLPLKGKAAHVWMTEPNRVHHVTSPSWAFISLHPSARSSVTDKAAHILTGGCSTSILLFDERGFASKRSNLQAQSGHQRYQCERRGWRPSCCISTSLLSCFMLLCDWLIKEKLTPSDRYSLYPRRLQIRF